MIEGFPIDRSAVFDDAALQASLGVSADALTKARKAGQLNFTRKGQRILYLGSWILEWLEADAAVAKGVNHAD